VAIAVQSDIETVWGTRNVAIWSNLDNDSTSANTARITAALSQAEDTINDRFRGQTRYAVPLTSNTGTHSQVVKTWAAVIAGKWLYDNRLIRGAPDTQTQQLVDARMAQVMQEIDSYVAGPRVMDYVLRSNVYGTAPSAI